MFLYIVAVPIPCLWFSGYSCGDITLPLALVCLVLVFIFLLHVGFSGVAQGASGFFGAVWGPVVLFVHWIQL